MILKFNEFAEYRKGSDKYGSLIHDIMLLLRNFKQDKEKETIKLKVSDLSLDFKKLEEFLADTHNLISFKITLQDKFGNPTNIIDKEGFILFSDLNAGNKNDKPWESLTNEKLDYQKDIYILYGNPSGEVLEIPHIILHELKKQELVKYVKFLQYNFIDDYIFNDEDRDQIDNVLNVFRLGIKKYVFNSDGSVNVEGNVDLSSRGLEKIPIRFNKIDGNFSVSYNKLTTLENAPKYVGKDFIAQHNKLTNLKDAPAYVVGDFIVSNNELTDLTGIQKVLKGSFSVHHNKLKNLKGSPVEINGSFDCSFNKIASLEGGPKLVEDNYNCSHNNLDNLIGAPDFIDADFNCDENSLTELLGAPKTVNGNFSCKDNFIQTLEDCPQSIGGNLYCKGNYIQEDDLYKPTKINGKIIYK